MFVVKCIEDNIEYHFMARTPLEALNKMIYCLNISGKCDAQINKTKSGLHLWFEDGGKTYCIQNQ